jgi:hypothetical protein
VPERLDDEKLAQLRAWAEALLLEHRQDLRAAARAMLMMVDEITRLRAASRAAFTEDIGTALAQRLGTGPTEAPAGRPPPGPDGDAAEGSRETTR